MRTITFLVMSSVFILASCGSSEEKVQTTENREKVTEKTSDGQEAVESADVSSENADPIAASIAHSGRPTEDIERDAQRKPAATLRFADVQPGQTIIEMEAGSGYYTELLSRAVGEGGTIYMQNPTSFDGFLGDALETRLGGDRLPNVELMRTNFDDLQVEDASVDLVTWIQGPHELWFKIDGEALGDPDISFSEIARVLKSGGAFVAIDHRAADGAGTEAGGTLHRIEESIVRALAEEAGLLLLKTSPVLANPEDPLEVSAFHPSIRGQTDQFMLYFVKPE